MNTNLVAPKPNQRRTQARPQSNPTASANAGAAAVIEQSFDGLNAQAPFVEHFTIPGFLRLIDHRWSFDDIRRFGNQAQQLAEAMGLAYVTAVDTSLGSIRMFPEKMLRRIYDTMSMQFGWPQIIDVDTPQLEDAKKKRDAIRATDRALKRLTEVIAETDDVTQLEALNATMKVLEARNAALRAELGEPLAVAS